jgi:hypothetical protein
MNHLRSNKDIGETKRTRSRTHRSDRKTGSITDHDGRRTRGVRRSDRRKDTRISSSVVRGWAEEVESRSARRRQHS